MSPSWSAEEKRRSLFLATNEFVVSPGGVVVKLNPLSLEKSV
jgi:hypothetical protein